MSRFLAILLLFGIPVSLPAALPTPKIVNTTISPTPDGQRFLFLVDISASMEDLQPEIEATVYELIRSGIDGYMRAGDTYGIWTFNKQAYGGRFPMQVWDPKKVSPLATIAAAFLSDQTYEKTSSLKHAIESLGPVIRAVSNLNVLIISDGGSSMRGTPFDQAINADYKKKGRERRDLKRPFVTTLIVRDGWFINNSVRISGQPIPMPDRPLPEVVATKTNLPPVTAAASVGNGKVLDHTAVVDAIPNPKAAQTSSVPAVVVKPSPGEEVQVVTAATQASNGINAQVGAPVNNSVAASLSNSVESPRPKFVQISTKPSSIPTNTSVIAHSATTTLSVEAVPSGLAEVTNAIASTSPTVTPPQPIEQNPAVQPSVAPATQTPPEPTLEAIALAAINSPPIPITARELNPESPPAQPALPAMQAVTTPARSGLEAGFMIAFGSVLLAATLFLLLVTARRTRPAPQGSLITQSMDTQTMQRR